MKRKFIIDTVTVIDATIRAKSGLLFVYKNEAKPKLKMNTTKNSTIGIKTPRVSTSLSFPHGSWLKIGI